MTPYVRLYWLMLRRTFASIIALSELSRASSRGCRPASARAESAGVHPSSSRMRVGSPSSSGTSFGRKRAGSTRTRMGTRARARSMSSTSRMATARARADVVGPPGRPRSAIARYARTVSRTSVRSRRASRLPTPISGGCRPASIAAICRANPEVENAGSCRGPKWLNARAMRDLHAPAPVWPSEQLLRELAQAVRARWARADGLRSAASFAGR